MLSNNEELEKISQVFSIFYIRAVGKIIHIRVLSNFGQLFGKIEEHFRKS